MSIESHGQFHSKHVLLGASSDSRRQGSESSGPPHLVKRRDSSRLSTRSTILFIQECGMKLGAREITVATACMLYHRYRRLQIGASTQNNACAGSSMDGSTFIDLPPPHGEAVGERASNPLDDNYTIASCCLLLAGKIEENHFNVRHLINVAYQTYFRDKELRSIEEYYSIRSSLMSLELWLLRLVAFQPTCEHPHKYLVCFLKSLEDWLVPGTLQRYPVAAVSWSMLRDAYLQCTVINEKPEHLAVAIVACALQLFSISIPGDEKASHSWIKAFCRDLDSDHLERIIESLTEVYLEKRCFS